MKVCFANTNKAWGGGEKWHYEQAALLYTAGFMISFICDENSELYKKIKNKPYTIFTIKSGKLSFLNPRKKAKVKSFLYQAQPKTVILNLPQDVKLVAPIAKKLGISKIIYRRGMDHPIKRNWINKNIYINCLTHFIANSKNVASSITKNFPELEDRIHVIYNSVSLLEVPPPKKRNDKLVLGNLGRLVEQKGQTDLIELAVVLKEQDFNFEILIAGTGPLQEVLDADIKSRGLENEVKLIGHTDSHLFFKRIDFFIFPSRFEGLSNALLEALLNRKCIFAYDVSSNREVIDHSSSGFLFNVNEIDSMARKIVEVAKDSKEIEKIQQNGLEKLKKTFDRNKTTQQLIELVS